MTTSEREFLEAVARLQIRWEKMTGLKGDCFMAYATWLILQKRFPELDGPG